MFEVFQSATDGKHYFRLKAENCETILTGQGYAQRRSCLRGIRSVKKNAVQAAQFDQMTSNDGRLYFVLRAANTQVIGRSQQYDSVDGIKVGIESVMQNAPQSDVKVVSEA
ncbi:MAG: hypothetical protein A2W31_12775 [Planctomycetes bacterium RBG_16_64_10]|nr:MAG: hypothetical protein A2W31_12775 [Planctomycetes bacterium RBG_16_64_10]